MPEPNIPPYPLVMAYIEALQWHPDLFDDLRQCSAFLRATWPHTIPSDTLLDQPPVPLVMTTAWLRHRYPELWPRLPQMPVGALRHALQAAAIAGTWRSAVPVVREWMQRYERTTHVYVDGLADARDLCPPPWLADLYAQLDADPAELPVFPAIVLLPFNYASRDEIESALKEWLIDAWPAMSLQLEKPIGTRPGVKAQGAHPQIARSMTLYRLWRKWCRENPPNKDRFANKVSSGELQVFVTANRLFADAKRTGRLARSAPQLPDRLVWLLGKDTGDIKKRLSKLDWLDPDETLPPLTTMAGRLINSRTN